MLSGDASEERRPPLDGIRVLELGQVISAPYAGLLLADLGAEVIKIEPPGAGDSARNPAVTPMGDESATFLTFNRNKRSMVLDLKSPAGRERFWSMVATADVVLSNMVPAVAARLGVDPMSLRDRNPRVISCSIVGFRSTDDRVDEPTYDLTHQAASGIMMMEGRSGDPPLRVSIPVADLGAACFATQAILAALVERGRSGLGDHIEVPMYDTMLSLLTYTSTLYLNTGKGPRRMGSDHEYTAPWQVTYATDGPLVVAVRSDRFWQRLCEAIGRPAWISDERYETNARRLEHREELREDLDAVFATRSVERWLGILRDAGVPAAPVRTVEEALDRAAIEVPHLIDEIEHPTLGPVRFVRNPIAYARQGLADPVAAPMLGEFAPPEGR